MSEEEIPIGITRHEDGSSAVSPLSDQECPVCGYEHFWSTTTFYGEWSPSSAATAVCDECGAEFELQAKVKDDD
ncbi:hypothetical protein [Halocatena halophila]|uniref:hypothetical protein n=1 Tax=Halocatena halophila TaxID=2814576 RepID=UPI002ED4FFE5